MNAQLRIEGGAYAMDCSGFATAAFAGGARQLLGTSATLASVEAAIERAEEWLMPWAASLQGGELQVHDATGRLARGIAAVMGSDETQWPPEALESLFARTVDRVAGQRATAPAMDDWPGFVADVVLLRELTHHGRLRGLRLV